MRTLAFDTAMGACSAAALEGERVLASRLQLQVKGHAETVMDMIAEVCAEAGLKVQDFDRLGVTVGPGTFTGQRVGLAAARAMVLGTSVKLVGVTTLEAVAAGVDEPDTDEIVAAVFDARRGEVYLQAFDKDLNALSEAAAQVPDEAARALLGLGRRFMLVGTGCALVADLMTAAGAHVVLSDASPYPDATIVARLASRALPVTSAPPVPLYLRAPDAKLPTPKVRP